MTLEECRDHYTLYGREVKVYVDWRDDEFTTKEMIEEKINKQVFRKITGIHIERLLSDDYSLEEKIKVVLNYFQTCQNNMKRLSPVLEACSEIQ